MASTDLWVGVRFRKAGAAYPYAVPPGMKVHQEDFVVVPTPRGDQVGWVIKTWEQAPGAWEPQAVVHRVATPRDLMLWQLAQQKGLEALVNARAQAKRLDLKGVFFAHVEVSLDHRVFTFEYHLEGQPVEPRRWRRLQEALQRLYSGKQLHFQRIGARDAAKLTGGAGVCGAVRCCALFLTDFQSIQIRMAKDQHLSLVSEDITGMCGRLRCCLAFEHAVYQELLQALPKLKSRVRTPRGEGKVVDVLPLQEQVVVEFADRTRMTFHKDQIQFHPPCQNCPRAQAS